ncbi:MAG TPA: DUF2231 domain-containing protein, partial [Flavitalea sp.]|nr:DUF2231 domain-containing protein [Flavitalea sp.]
MLLSIETFIAHLHPALVHLPIGILFITCVYQWMTPASGTVHSFWSGIMLLTGSITALLSCITGLVLSGNGEYESDAVQWHQWSGIVLFIFSLLLLFLHYTNRIYRNKILFTVLFVLIVVTGHLGANLTHGEGYLFEGFTDSEEQKEKIPKRIISNVDSAAVYADLVEPILKD